MTPMYVAAANSRLEVGGRVCFSRRFIRRDCSFKTELLLRFRISCLGLLRDSGSGFRV